MISFRSHVVSLMAVFLALAIGVVLGGGPLSEVGRGASAEDVAAAQGEASQARANAKAAVAYSDKFAIATAGRTIAGGLTGQTVVILRMPGAPDGVVDAIAGLVDTAGGMVVGNYQLERSLFDPDQSALVDTLGSQLATTLGAPNIAAVPSYPRIGRLIGLGTATTTPAGVGFDNDAVAIRESLTGAELATSVSEPTRRGALVLLVLGDEPAPDSAVDTMLTGVASGLAEVAKGVVLAGPGSSALLAAVRANDDLSAKVSTLDSVDTGAGQVAAVLALSASAAGTAGSYGASGSDGAVPLR